MAQDGQADTAPDNLETLANFLADNPDADGSGPALEGKKQASEESDEDNSDELDADPADDESTDEDDESEQAEEQPSLKFKVPIKGEDGTDQTIEVDQKELVAGYQRHSDYTRKTQELANKEREVTQVVSERLQEGQRYYMEQAQLAHAAVRQLAGLRSPDDMAQLAQTDPAAWVQEQQRQSYVQNMLSQLEQGVRNETQQQAQQRKSQEENSYAETWQVLKSEGIDRPKLTKIFDTMKSKYQVSDSRLASVNDPVLVRIMRDAAAYQELRDKKAVVTKKATDAPRLPTQRQSVPRDESRAKALDKKFSSGKAKLDDLAKFLELNHL